MSNRIRTDNLFRYCILIFTSKASTQEIALHMFCQEDLKLSLLTYLNN